MKIIPIANIEARARRLNQPEMVERYLEMAISEKDGRLDFIDEDHAWLNTLWNETGKPSNHQPTVKQPCKGCTGV